MKTIKILTGLFLLLPMLVFGQGITVSTGSGLDVVLGGEVELEFVDVEGKGGFTHQDLTYQKVKNRSPHMRIDMAVLSTRVNYNENLYYLIEFRFDDASAYVDKQYARLNVPSMNTQFELGKNRPFVATKRQSEGYPLVGTAFWKGREAHLTADTELPLGEKGKILTGLSLGMKRPFGTDDAAEDKSFKMLVYDEYEPKAGQTIEYGVKAGVELAGLKALGWFYTGQLIDDWDWKISLKQSLAPYSTIEGSISDTTHYWFGGRLDYDIAGLHLRGEYVEGKDGLLSRYGYYGEGSYTIPAPAFLHSKSLSFLGRYGALRLRPADNMNGQTISWAYLSEAMSWNRQMTTISTMLEINDNLALKVEYYLLGEETGWEEDPTIPDEDELDQSSVKDNQFLLHLNFKF